jgi:hypothetical protein
VISRIALLQTIRAGRILNPPGGVVEAFAERLSRVSRSASTTFT